MPSATAVCVRARCTSPFVCVCVRVCVVSAAEVVTLGLALATGRSGGGFGVGVFDEEEGDPDVEVFGVDNRANYLRSLGDDDDEDGDGTAAVLARLQQASRPEAARRRLDAVAAPRHGSDLLGFHRATVDNRARGVDAVYAPPTVPLAFTSRHRFSDADDEEFARLRRLIHGGSDGVSLGANAAAMTSQSRAVLLGEAVVAKPAAGGAAAQSRGGAAAAPPPTATVAPPQLPDAAAMLASVFDSRFVKSSDAPGGSSATPLATAGGLFSKSDFESRCGW
jgi:hypothetical protein